MKWFDDRCLCGHEMYCHLVSKDDEVFWCDECGRMVIIYKGNAPDEYDWNTPEIIGRDFNG